MHTITGNNVSYNLDDINKINIVRNISEESNDTLPSFIDLVNVVPESTYNFNILINLLLI